MAKVDITRAAFVQINAAAQRVQVFGGRVQIAASASPAALDWQVLSEGQFLELTAVKYARAIDTTPTWVIALDI